MSKKQEFGGPWTIEKLNILSNYLGSYARALKLQSFQLIYIDCRNNVDNFRFRQQPFNLMFEHVARRNAT